MIKLGFFNIITLTDPIIKKNYRYKFMCLNVLFSRKYYHHVSRCFICTNLYKYFVNKIPGSNIIRL